ncbi:MAG: hypothetical protein Q9218_000276 [Villophora microphyllina]
MKARGVTALYHRALVGNSLLPFLYQTSTIQSPVRLTTTARRSLHTSIPRQGVYVKEQNAIPFETEDGTYEQDITNLNPNEDRPERQSTITATERAVFERIFKEISEDQFKKATREENPLDDDLEDELPGGGDVYSDLDAIFEAALTDARRIDPAETGKRGVERPLKHYNLALNPFKNTGIRKLERSEFRGDEYREDVAIAVADHELKVLKMFEAARSDREIWNVLETEVFTLIKQYDSFKKQAKQREQAEKPKRKRGYVPKADKAAITDAEKAKELPAAEQSDQEEKLQAILSSNYGEYCLSAMRHLRRAYPTSPYCMNLLPAIKRLGPISHVLAASTDLYNEILFLQWKEYSDLLGMADTIIEMRNQAIETNKTTLLVLKIVQRTRWRVKRADNPMKVWWEVAPVKEGWHKLKYLSRVMLEESAQAKSRRLMEEAARNRMEGEGEVNIEEGSTWDRLLKQKPKEERSSTEETVTTAIMDRGLEVPSGQRIML